MVVVKSRLASPLIDDMSNNMVSIPGGHITLRDDRTKRNWTNSITPFLLSKYLVTQELYYAITGKTPSALKGDRHPVESVSWNEAIEFCNLVSRKAGLQEVYLVSDTNATIDSSANGYRLPTDAEWEYACRAGSSQVRYGELDDIAWYENNANNSTHPVGQKEPNTWGVYDMLGNVWEWCWDLYDEEVYGTYRVFRGGGWSDKERGCLASNRRRSHPTFQIDDLGFRLARSIQGIKTHEK